jgi:hypothetical protein
MKSRRKHAFHFHTDFTIRARISSLLRSRPAGGLRVSQRIGMPPGRPCAFESLARRCRLTAYQMAFGQPRSDDAKNTEEVELSTDVMPQTRRPAGRFPILPVVLAVLVVAACGAYLMERNVHVTEKAALEAQLLQLRTETEGLKTKLRSREHDVATKPKAELKRGS